MIVGVGGGGLKSGCSTEERCQVRNKERGYIVSPHKVPVWLSAPMQKRVHVLSIWWCKTHIWKKLRWSVGGPGTAR